MTTHLEPIFIGVASGTIFRAALTKSRWFASLVFSAAATAVIVVILVYGLAGLEVYGRQIVAIGLRNGPLMLGAGVGFVAAGTFFNNASLERRR